MNSKKGNNHLILIKHRNMKTKFSILKTLFFTLVFILVPMTMLFALQEEASTEPEFSIFKSIWQLALAVLGGGLMTAVNHLVARTFKFKLWFKDTFKPALWAFSIGLVLGLVDAYIPFLDVLLEKVFAIETDVRNTAAMATISFFLVPIIKGMFKQSDTKAKVFAKS